MISFYFGGKSHVSNGQNVSFKEPCENKDVPDLDVPGLGLALVPVHLLDLLGFRRHLVLHLLHDLPEVPVALSGPRNS